MKRTEFIKSLQRLKEQIIQTQKQNRNFMIPTENTHSKSVCTCIDSNGENKYLYSSKEELEYLLSSKHIKLQSYPCPYEKGWHLTKG